MRRFFLISLISFFGTLFLFPNNAFAIENPLSIPNNKIGVHILFPEEIDAAARLINANGGDWGYITIPIQAGDRNLEKWQKFMDDAKKLHIIPIVRLATIGDYFNTSVWKKPTPEDVLDFANFLNSLEWPVKNRYIIVFNEVNRSDEWEGNLNPSEYAEILNYAVTVFKSLDSDFFIISAGLDNAAPNTLGKYMNEYDYMTAMNAAFPGIFGLIDGLGSHSYPNPGFKQMPYKSTNQNVHSFNFEKNLAYELSSKNLPVFITETGWSKKTLSEKQIAESFEYTFKNVWSNNNIVAVTPFLLQAGKGSFFEFSLLDENGNYNEISGALASLPKTKGQPTENRTPSSYLSQNGSEITYRTFPQGREQRKIFDEKLSLVVPFLKWFLKLNSL